MRELKFHERKLLKKVDFLRWGKAEKREDRILRRYYIQSRRDLRIYAKVVGIVRKVVEKIMALKPSDIFRVKKSAEILKKFYEIGVINNKDSLKSLFSLSVSQLCRRRLAVVLTRNHYTQTIKDAVKFIEQGQIQIGKDVVLNPAMLISRSTEDLICWSCGSKIKKKVDEYNARRDEYDEEN